MGVARSPSGVEVEVGLGVGVGSVLLVVVTADSSALNHEVDRPLAD